MKLDQKLITFRPSTDNIIENFIKVRKLSQKQELFGIEDFSKFFIVF